MSATNDYFRLGSADILPDRPFTNPAHNAEDLASLDYMLDVLRRLLSQPGVVPLQPRPYVLFIEGERRHRIALARPEVLLTCSEPAVVGFCGNSLPGADRTPLEQADEELLNEFMEHSDLLSYSSLEVGDNNWRNLVLFSHPQGIDHWTVSNKHKYAAQVLSLGYYRHIRLHNGVLPGRLMSGSRIVLHRTKYYDFHDRTIWWAVRDLQA